MNSISNKHHKTLEVIFSNPIQGNIEWRRIEALFVALGCDVIEGSGSRVTFLLKGHRRDFHRPHPSKEALRYRVREARDFLIEAGITP